MLKAIEIENFKGISQRVRIDFAPVTLLFGPNAAGKSTIIHALHFLYEAIVKGNRNPSRSSIGGDSIDFGGFRNLIHKREPSRAMKFSIEFDVSELVFALHHCENDIDSGRFGRLELTFEWSEVLREVVVTESKFFFENTLAIALESNRDCALKTAITRLNLAHPMLKPRQPKTELDGMAAILDSFTSLSNQPEFVAPSGNDDNIIDLNMTDCISTVSPLLPRAFGFLVNAPLNCLREVLKSHIYLGPLRKRPSSRFEYKRQDEYQNRWADGSSAWDALNENETLCGYVSEWLESLTRLNTGYKIEQVHHREVSTRSPLWRILTEGDRVHLKHDELKALFLSLPERSNVLLYDMQNGVYVRPTEVGVGLSQVIPVVTAAAQHSSRTITTVEQPELHLHPATQTALGDMLIYFAQEYGVLFVETHSEHLILRILRRVRESTFGGLPKGIPKISPTDIAVYYAARDDQGALYFKHLEIDSDGEFIDRWPNGFFTERQKEWF